MQEALTPEAERSCGNEGCSELARPSRLKGRVPLYCSKKCQGATERRRRKEAALAQTERWCRECDQTKPIDQFTRPLAFYCRDCVSARNKERYVRAGGTDTAYERGLQYRYGMTMDEYNHRRWEQGSRCAICGEKPEERLCVDHDHKTNAIRDLLCARCNHALGNAREDPAVLRAMADYLERHTQRDPATLRYAPERPARKRKK
ncbi:endonuclease domain-containing protein [Streptomyces sp. NPDC060243]|uniref:endonuclease domain-containing protein n=1 Tax=Streptomyces sp. NPDC060243 TaxID=3347081 RepID=UPI00365FFDD2